MTKPETLFQWNRQSLRTRNGHYILLQLWPSARNRLFRMREDVRSLRHAIRCEICSWAGNIRLLYTKRLDLCGLVISPENCPIPHHLFRKAASARSRDILTVSSILPSASLVAGYLFLAGWDKGAQWAIAEGVRGSFHSRSEQTAVANSLESFCQETSSDNSQTLSVTPTAIARRDSQ